MSKRMGDRTVLAWWAALGLGLGLIMLALVVGLQQTHRARRSSPLLAQAQQLMPLLAPLRRGETPTPFMVKQAEGTVLGPLLQALLDAQRQRQSALMAYQTQIESISLGTWLTPTNLATAKGRALVRMRLDDLRAALDGLVRRDATVQGRLDEALLDWTQQFRSEDDAAWRHQLLASTASTAKAMSTFFKVEQDIVVKVDALLARLDQAGAGVTLEAKPAQDLVFARQEDLAFYQAALSELNELGQREQQWLVAAEKAGGQHARQVGDLITATIDKPD
jgi:hypothetical protein